MCVILKDNTGDLCRFFDATVELHPDMGILEIRWTDKKGSERLRTYILQNLVSYETFIPVPFDENEEEVKMDDDSNVSE